MPDRATVANAAYWYFLRGTTKELLLPWLITYGCCVFCEVYATWKTTSLNAMSAAAWVCQRRHGSRRKHYRGSVSRCRNRGDMIAWDPLRKTFLSHNPDVKGQVWGYNLSSSWKYRETKYKLLKVLVFDGSLWFNHLSWTLCVYEYFSDIFGDTSTFEKSLSYYWV